MQPWGISLNVRMSSSVNRVRQQLPASSGSELVLHKGLTVVENSQTSPNVPLPDSYQSEQEDRSLEHLKN
jgi:hypothetical protein